MEKIENCRRVLQDLLKETEHPLNKRLSLFIKWNAKEIGDRIRKAKTKAITCKDVCYASSDGYYVIPIGLHFAYNGISCYGAAYAATFKDENCKIHAVIWYNMQDTPSYFFLLNTHAISRYRKRQLKNEQLPFSKVIIELATRELPAIACGDFGVDTLKPYGNRKWFSQQFRSKNGLFLGYISADPDNKTGVFHLQTFLTEDMVRKSYPLLSIDNKEVATYVKFLTMMRSGNPAGLTGREDINFGLALDNGSSVLLTGERLRQHIRKAGEEYNGMSDDEFMKFMENQDLLRQENVQKYYDKLKRKGYT